MQPTQNSVALWDAPAPYVSHSITSAEAASSIRVRAKTLRTQVLEVLRTTPMTDEQLADHFGDIRGNTIRPRRVELCHAGLVIESGTTKTKSGRNAVVWVARENE